MRRYSPCESLSASTNYETKEEQEERFRVSSPYHLEQGKGSPTTVILHGMADHAVPLEQTRRFAGTLREMGTVVEEYYEEGAAHGFDQEYVVSHHR